jgi:hypothetical protein
MWKQRNHQLSQAICQQERKLEAKKELKSLTTFTVTNDSKYPFTS